MLLMVFLSIRLDGTRLSFCEPFAINQSPVLDHKQNSYTPLCVCVNPIIANYDKFS